MSFPKLDFDWRTSEIFTLMEMEQTKLSDMGWPKLWHYNPVVQVWTSALGNRTPFLALGRREYFYCLSAKTLYELRISV